MAIICHAILARELMPTNEEIADRLTIGLSSVPTILKRLEDRGSIKVIRFQRTRQVVVNGEATLMPANTAPHWRNRPFTQPVPSPGLDMVRQRSPEVAARILIAARREGKDFATFLTDMVWAGFALYEAEEG